MEDTPWINHDGEQFLKDIGVKPGDTVVDFGCGEGDYSIPAAQIVGSTGIVYAVDKKENILDELVSKIDLDNIVTVVTTDATTGIDGQSADVILVYDILHYGGKPQRTRIYTEAYRLLKKMGLMSVHPKHCKTDFPLGGLADMDIHDIIKEIENAHFHLQNIVTKKLLHDHTYTTGTILQFTRP
ncbi:MAG: class I SAM-dependent methyltransferase [Candidatus Methanofastidiosia archaeon]|jgi:ubiquinone/menaquinone biosynthesis C-methylase UbiE